MIIKLDIKKLLGFRIAGGKAGGNVGSKVGSKIGSKSGAKGGGVTQALSTK